MNIVRMSLKERIVSWWNDELGILKVIITIYIVIICFLVVYLLTV